MSNPNTAAHKISQARASLLSSGAPGHKAETVFRMMQEENMPMAVAVKKIADQYTNDTRKKDPKNEYSFCHLHRHCEASIQDGVGKVEDGVEYAAKLGHKAVAVTDHGNLISYVRFYNQAKASGVKHIFGLEAYLCDDMSKKDKESRDYNHCTILVKNEQGYKNILKLNNISHREGFYYRPRIDWDTLFKYKEGLIVLSGCVIGRTCQQILAGKFHDAMQWNKLMKKQFQDDYYMELMVSDFPEQAQCNKEIIRISDELKIPGVITGDAHYVRKEDYEAQKVMMLISAKATINEYNEQERRKQLQVDDTRQGEKDKIWVFSSDQYWMKNEVEMKESWEKWHKDYYPFEKFEDHMNESGKIADKVDIIEMDTSMKMPKADLEDGVDPKEYFHRKLWEGMTEKGFVENKVYEDRLKMEVDIIEQKGLVDYFIVNHDVVGWSKRNDIFVGPARGSAGGSLVCYLLGITEIDPIKYDLLFERFLDLGREEMPDIDTDFEIHERDSVKDYIAKRYGEKHVANISAMGTYRARNILRDTMRVFDYDPQFINKVSKDIPQDAVFFRDVDDDGNEVLDDDGYPVFKLQANEKDFSTDELDKVFEEKPTLKRICGNLFGQIRHVSKHAAGVIVTDKPLDETVATYRIGGEVMTAWTEGIYRKELSQLNVLKLDILGLKTLSILKRACELADIHYNDLLDVDLDNEEVYNMIYENISSDEKKRINGYKRIKGIFQFDSSTGYGLYAVLKPERFNDLVALSALDRPGPLDSKMYLEYVARKNKKIDELTYEHPEIQAVLGETHGIIVYQEQLMNLAKRLSGFDAIEASALRKNLVKIQLSKQAQDKVKKQRKILKKKFVDGAIANGAERETVERLWEAMTKFARYGFNKAHSVAYSMITFWTMYMKVYYPLEFFSALLTFAKDDEIPQIIAEMRSMNININYPDVNKSEIGFTPDKQSATILYGLDQIKYVGINAQDEILEKRPFASFKDFCDRTEKRKVNKRVKEALIKAGAFNNFEKDPGKLLTELSQMSAKKNEVVKEIKYYDSDRLNDEHSFLKVRISEDLKRFNGGWKIKREYFDFLDDSVRDTSKEIIEKLDENRGDTEYNFVKLERYTGYIDSVTPKVSKSGNEMVMIKMELYAPEEDKKQYMTFFIMSWDKLYKFAISLKRNDAVGVALPKRDDPKDFPNVKFIRKYNQ